MDSSHDEACMPVLSRLNRRTTVVGVMASVPHSCTVRRAHVCTDDTDRPWRSPARSRGDVVYTQQAHVKVKHDKRPPLAIRVGRTDL